MGCGYYVKGWSGKERWSWRHGLDSCLQTWHAHAELYDTQVTEREKNLWSISSSHIPSDTSTIEFDLSLGALNLDPGLLSPHTKWWRDNLYRYIYSYVYESTWLFSASHNESEPLWSTHILKYKTVLCAFWFTDNANHYVCTKKHNVCLHIILKSMHAILLEMASTNALCQLMQFLYTRFVYQRHILLYLTSSDSVGTNTLKRNLPHNM